MIIFEKEHILIRTLDESDAMQLVKWLSDPRILEYYEGRDRPQDLKLIYERFYTDDYETRCIVEYDKKPIGYCQYYQLSEESYDEYGYCKDELIYGMDQFIGEVAYWNKGIGTKLVKTLIEYLFEQLGAKKIVMNPQTWNVRALRCYEKCGFKKVKILFAYERHEGQMRDCWLIEYEKGQDS